MSSAPAAVPANAAVSSAREALGPLARVLVMVAFWGNLVCQMGIIVTGGVVRLTGSGLGCTTWPNCTPGKFTPEYSAPMGIHGFIEFGNRALTGVLSVFSVLLLVVALIWLRRKGIGFLVLAAVPFVGTIAQAFVGWLIISTDLHPGVVGPHLLISTALVVVSAVLVARLYEGDGRARSAVPGPVLALGYVLATVAAAVLLLGTVVTGSGPHSGDAVHPVRLGLDPRMMSWLHADAVMLFSGLLVGMVLIVHLAHLRSHARRAAWVLVAVTLLQAVIGYTQYFTALPEVLVGLHMTGAALFTAAVTWLVTTLYTWRAAEPAVTAEDVAPSVGSAA